MSTRHYRQQRLLLVLAISFFLGRHMHARFLITPPEAPFFAPTINPESGYALGIPLPLSCSSELDIERIKGVGAETAKAIKQLSYHHLPRSIDEENTYFSKQLLAIKGIGEKRLALLKQHLLPPLPGNQPSSWGNTCSPNRYYLFSPSTNR